MFAIGRKANIQISARKNMKLRAATMTQKKLIERPEASAAGAVAAAAARKFTVRAPSTATYLKRASRPTTIARTPRPSAQPARMIARPRIWPAASGLRPIALLDMPARMPMPMPGPMTPSAARPAPMCSTGGILGNLLCLRRRPKVSMIWRSGRHGLRLVRLRLIDAADTHRVTWRMVLGFVALDGDQDEHQGQDREDEGLDQVEERLQPYECDGDHGQGKRRDNGQCNLTAVDVAEESHRERDRLHELEEEFDYAHIHGQDARPEAVAELSDREELAQVTAHAKTSEAFALE